jgi:hypothetical protein
MVNKSSIDVNVCNIFDNLEQTVYLLVDFKDENQMITFDDIVHVFKRKNDYEQFQSEVKKYMQTDIIKATLGLIIQDVLDQDLMGISLHGFYENEDSFTGTLITKEDLERKRGVIETSYYLMACSMGEETPETTIYNIAKQYFYFLSDEKGMPIFAEMEVKGKIEKVVPIFTTKNTAITGLQTVEQNKEIQVRLDTLFNISQKTEKEFKGFSLGLKSFIDKESIVYEHLKYSIQWDNNNINSYLKYLSNQDELYIILSSKIDVIKKKGTPLFFEDNIGEKSVLIFEKKDDAQHFIDSRPEIILNEIYPIGIFNPSCSMKHLLEELYINDISKIIFNINTQRHLELSIQDTYKTIYKKEVTKSNISSQTTFNLIERNKRKDDEQFIFDTIKHIINVAEIYTPFVSTINLAYDCNVEELLYAIEYLNSKIKQSENNKDLSLWNDIRKNLCMVLLLRLEERGDVFLLCNKDKKPIIENDCATILVSTKHIHITSTMIPIKLTTTSIKELSKYCKSFIITDGYKNTTILPIDIIDSALKTYNSEYEKYKFKIYSYLSCKSNLSLVGIRWFFGALLTNKQLFEEVVYVIDNGQYPSEVLEVNKAVAQDFDDNNEDISSSYVEFIEYLCNIIPDINS